MRDHSSATDRRRVALRAATALRRAWREGVYVNELTLSGPWERDGTLFWRRDPDGGWTLVGSTPPPVATSAAGEVSPRRAPSSC